MGVKITQQSLTLGFLYQDLSEGAVEQEKKADFKSFVTAEIGDYIDGEIQERWADIPDDEGLGRFALDEDGHIPKSYVEVFLKQQLKRVNDLNSEEDEVELGEIRERACRCNNGRCPYGERDKDWCKAWTYELMLNGEPWTLQDAVENFINKKRSRKKEFSPQLRAQVSGLRIILHMHWHVTSVPTSGHGSKKKTTKKATKRKATKRKYVKAATTKRQSRRKGSKRAGTARKARKLTTGGRKSTRRKASRSKTARPRAGSRKVARRSRQLVKS